MDQNISPTALGEAGIHTGYLYIIIKYKIYARKKHQSKNLQRRAVRDVFYAIQ
jgi:hypothetical protein